MVLFQARLSALSSLVQTMTSMLHEMIFGRIYFRYMDYTEPNLIRLNKLKIISRE